jgi:hypothetical protein
LDSRYGSLVYWCWARKWESLWDRDRHCQSQSNIPIWMLISSIWELQTVFVAPCFIGRIAAPPQQIMLWTMIGVTTVFGSCLCFVGTIGLIVEYGFRSVVGYSWINTHLAVIANLGVGVTIGWKRA